MPVRLNSNFREHDVYACKSHIVTSSQSKQTSTQNEKKKRTEEKNKETGYECVMVFYAPFVRLFDQNKLFIHFEMSSSRFKLMINISFAHETFVEKNKAERVFYRIAEIFFRILTT